MAGTSAGARKGWATRYRKGTATYKGRRAPRTSVFTQLLPETVRAHNRAAGAAKAKRTKHGKAVMRRATALRRDEAWMAEYRIRKPIADAIGRRSYRQSGGSTHYRRKDRGRALMNPELHAPGAYKRAKRKQGR